jgi:DNA-binding CsgD family transcriptional regulator
MARRVVYVGGLAELEETLRQYCGHLVPDQHYVFGRYCHATEEADLMWEDLRACFRRAKLTSKQRFALAKALQLVSYAEIAREMGIATATVRDHVKAGYAKLDALPPGCVGCWTTVVEQCGGWSGVRHFVRDMSF